MSDTEDDLTPVSFAPGYMGTDSAWCYYETEYSDEGSVGPFVSMAEAAMAALKTGEYTVDDADMLAVYVSAGRSLCDLLEWMADHEKRRPSLAEIGAAVKLFKPGAWR